MNISLNKPSEKPDAKASATDVMRERHLMTREEEAACNRRNLMVLGVLLLVVLSAIALFLSQNAPDKAPATTTLSLPNLRIGVADDAFADIACSPKIAAHGVGHFVLNCQSYPASSQDVLLQALDYGSLDLAVLPLDLFQQWSVHKGQETNRALMVLGQDRAGQPILLAGASDALEQKQRLIEQYIKALYGIHTGEEQDLISSSQLEPEVARPQLDAQLVPLQEGLALLGQEVTPADRQWLRGLVQPATKASEKTPDAIPTAAPGQDLQQLDATAEAIIALTDGGMIKILGALMIVFGLVSAFVRQEFAPLIVSTGAGLVLIQLPTILKIILTGG